MQYALFISCPRHVEPLLAEELAQLAVEGVTPSALGVYAKADLSALYRICLWSRFANRVQLILFSAGASTKDELYQRCYDYAWDQVFDGSKTFAIQFHGRCDFINNAMYGAQLVKDAIVDYFRHQNKRPEVDRHHPQVLLHAFIKHNQLMVSLDVVGFSLHQRGYRVATTQAPLKENVAAAVLHRAGWPSLMQDGASLVDPCCGSGTFLIEAAMMAGQRAPGLLRDDQQFRHWVRHDESLWQALRAEARERQQAIAHTILGFDHDPAACQSARQNIKAAGLCDDIVVAKQPIAAGQTQPGPGLLVANPPYGERLQQAQQLVPLYTELGQLLDQHYRGWHAAILTHQPMLAQAVGLRSHKQYSFLNGALEVKLYCFALKANNKLRFQDQQLLSDGQQAFANRLRKNLKHLQKWLKRTGHGCFRCFDADIPEYAFAIDVYQDWVHVQEYVAPAHIPAHKTQQRVLDVMHVLPSVLNVAPDHIVLKRRQRQKGKQQYQPLAKQRDTLVITEGRAKLLVNLHDYLDTGVFLDHRLLRLQFGSQIKAYKFLNCFCYTATASVHAALNGAQTTNVDLSATYLAWAQQNFRLNQIDLRQHHFIRADVTRWLAQSDQYFDVIFLDPPSFSNSKKMQDTLDIQRDHGALIDAAMARLTQEGQLYFSNNLKKFKLDESLRQRYQVTDITAKTLDEDFKRAKPSHQCFLLTH